MSNSKQWEDWLDEERAQEKGEYVLHRNYIAKDQFLYSIYPDVERRSVRTKFIGNTKPIATGITAFLAGDNRSSEYVKYYLHKGKPFSTTHTYHLYCKVCEDAFLKKIRSLPYQEKIQDMEQDFLSAHLNQEKKNYLKSLRYFTENKDEHDKRLNQLLKEYVNGYFLWLESQQHKKIKSGFKNEISLEASMNEGDNSKEPIIKESVIIKLWEEFGELFPDETKEQWQKRWIDDTHSLNSIRIEKFNQGNNKHLLLSILHLARPKMKVANMNEYVKKRWGLPSYNSDVSKHISHSEQPHPDVRKIEQILKSA